ncbi:MAG: hypothetical protein JNM27_09060 [Leptospirales bacterium]|nr:hypothetical protein [Leptospirales bacterium]
MSILRNVLAVLLGAIGGSIVNMGLIIAGNSVIPAPAGVDPANMESLKASMHLFGPEHFVFPFLAHALGTFAGAAIASLVASSHKITFAMAVGVLFLLGGITNTFMLPAPIWFVVLDLIAAYLPTAYAAGKILGGSR